MRTSSGTASGKGRKERLLGNGAAGQDCWRSVRLHGLRAGMSKQKSFENWRSCSRAAGQAARSALPPRFGQAPEAHGERHGAYRDLKQVAKKNKNSRRCLPISGGQRRRMGEINLTLLTARRRSSAGKWDTISPTSLQRRRYGTYRLAGSAAAEKNVVPFGWSTRKPIPQSKSQKHRKAMRCTISLRQIEIRKTDETITAAVYLYQVDNDGDKEIRFDFLAGTAEIGPSQILCKPASGCRMEAPQWGYQMRKSNSGK